MAGTRAISKKSTFVASQQENLLPLADRIIWPGYGFIDFVYFDVSRDGWVIVDFKTGKESEDKNSKYQEQLDFYQAVMEGLAEGKVVETRLLWL